MPSQLQVAKSSACPVCGDTGWKTVANGKNSGVSRCPCRLNARPEHLLASARIPSRYKDASLWDFLTANDSSKQALLTARTFVQKYPVEADGLIFKGTVGVGKTYLAIAIIRELVMTKGIACLFYDYRELLKEIQTSYRPSSSTAESDVLKPVFEAEVLVLDDLGADKPSDWVRETVSHILNTRYNHKRTTIITTNLPDRMPVSGSGNALLTDPTLEDRIGVRMLSRLYEMCKEVKMHGPDRRRASTATPK